MLVTIASNSDADASHFTNHFPEGLIIPKNSSIGVVNCSYILREGYTIQTGVNDTFQIKLGNMIDYITCTIAPSNYSTLTLLAVAVQASIAAALGTQSVFIRECFPVAEQTVSADDESSNITFHFIFDLSSQDPDNFVTNTNAFIFDTAKTFGSNGVFANDIVNAEPASPGTSSVRTSDGGANQNFLVTTHKNPSTASYEGVFRSTYQSVNKESEMLLKTSANQLPATAPIQVKFTVSNQVQIFEMIGGVRTQVNDATQAISVGDSVEIQIPEVDPSQTQPIVASYFITSGATTVEIPVSAPSTGRRVISQYDEFIPCVEFTTNSTTGKVPIINDTQGVDAILTSTISGAGTGFNEGEVLVQAASSGVGVGASIIILETGAGGNVTQFEFVSTGKAYTPNETISFSGGTGTNFGLTVNTVRSTLTYTSGTGYTAATTLSVTGGAGTGATFRVETVNAGEITSLTTISGGSGYGADDTLTLQGGNNDAVITLGTTVSEYNRLTNVKANLILAPMNQRPLVLKRDIKLKTGNFNTIFNGNARYDDTTGDKKIESGKIVSNNRVASNIHIQLNDFGPIESREKNSNGKTVAVVPLGDNSNTASGLFNNELFNIVYHKLENPEPLSNNELSVRLTDFNSNTLVSLNHPVTITLDIRPPVV